MPWGIINMTIGLLIRFQENVVTDDVKGKTRGTGKVGSTVVRPCIF